MSKLRVLIVNGQRVIDVAEFEDPRVRYVTDFNQLNESTSYSAVIHASAEHGTAFKGSSEHCRVKRRCQRLE